MILDLIYFDNPLLRKKSKPVEKFDDQLKKLAVDMVDTMDYHRGVGLAAVQVGKLLQLFIIRPEIRGPNDEFLLGEPEVYINPKITFHSEEQEVMLEGCLSIPGLHLEVSRPKKIIVEACRLDGSSFKEEIFNFKAREILHENDHLHGKLFIDHLDASKRVEIKDTLKELHRKYNF